MSECSRRKKPQRSFADPPGEPASLTHPTLCGQSIPSSRVPRTPSRFWQNRPTPGALRRNRSCRLHAAEQIFNSNSSSSIAEGGGIDEGDVAMIRGVPIGALVEDGHQIALGDEVDLLARQAGRRKADRFVPPAVAQLRIERIGRAAEHARLFPHVRPDLDEPRLLASLSPGNLPPWAVRIHSHPQR